jgi:hypothetical protein
MGFLWFHAGGLRSGVDAERSMHSSLHDRYHSVNAIGYWLFAILKLFPIVESTMFLPTGYSLGYTWGLLLAHRIFLA